MDYPIAYQKILLEDKSNYSVTEWKYLAIFLAIKRLNSFLYRSHFTIVTDRFSLKCSQQINYPNGHLFRWALKLHHHNFTIVHQSVSMHQIQTDCIDSPVTFLRPEDDPFLTSLAAMTYFILKFPLFKLA